MHIADRLGTALDHIEPPVVAGPSLTVVDVGAGVAADLTRRRRTRTRLAVVVAERGEAALSVLRDVTVGAPRQFDTELVVVDPDPGDGGTSMAHVAHLLDPMAWPWVGVERPAGGRADALDLATATAVGDFLVVPRDGTAVAELPPALGHLWVHGADALVVSRPGAGGAPGAEPNVPSGVVAGEGDAASRVGRRLAEALGLRTAEPDVPAPAMAVLRRWVARFLLDELGRALDPLEEFESRTRLLDLRLVEAVTAG